MEWLARGGNAFKPERKNRLEKTIRRHWLEVGWWGTRRQESKDTVYHRLMTKTWGQFWLKTPNNKKMAKNSFSLSFVLMSRVAEVFKMWIWGAWVFSSLTILWEAAVFVWYIYICLATFNFKAAVRVVSWRKKKSSDTSCWLWHFLLFLYLYVFVTEFPLTIEILICVEQWLHKLFCTRWVCECPATFFFCRYSVQRL